MKKFLIPFLALWAAGCEIVSSESEVSEARIESAVIYRNAFGPVEEVENGNGETFIVYPGEFDAGVMKTALYKDVEDAGVALDGGAAPTFDSGTTLEADAGVFDEKDAGFNDLDGDVADGGHLVADSSVPSLDTGVFDDVDGGTLVDIPDELYGKATDLGIKIIGSLPYPPSSISIMSGNTDLLEDISSTWNLFHLNYDNGPFTLRIYRRIEAKFPYTHADITLFYDQDRTFIRIRNVQIKAAELEPGAQCDSEDMLKLWNFCSADTSCFAGICQ